MGSMEVRKLRIWEGSWIKNARQIANRVGTKNNLKNYHL